MTAALALSLGAATALPSQGGSVTIGLITIAANKPAFDVLIPNFERVYPSITVEPTYAPNGTVLYQLEATELAAGDAPDILQTTPGCGAPNALCTLAKAGELAPMIAVPWARRSIRLLTSLEKNGAGLYAFTPNVSPFGLFTNDALFARLGLKVPQTFAQLLDLCPKATAAGAVPVLLDGANPSSMSYLIYDLVASTVYRTDRHWNSELRAGGATFDSSPGWHQALQEVVDLQNAGCFSPGVAGTTTSEAQFAQGQGLMMAGTSGLKGVVDAASPQFRYTFHPFPGATSAETAIEVAVPNSFSINAHSSAGNQAAGQTFIDFLARAKQDALFAEIKGGLTPDEFRKNELPPFMSSFAPLLVGRDYVIQPSLSWCNAGVQAALQQQAIGLLTGQSTVDGVLTAMDAAWQQGPC
jgi:raffinose/stachyose/melibiose transport system substrate-binding protein